jgi:hypothetical protein
MWERSFVSLPGWPVRPAAEVERLTPEVGLRCLTRVRVLTSTPRIGNVLSLLAGAPSRCALWCGVHPPSTLWATGACVEALASAGAGPLLWLRPRPVVVPCREPALGLGSPALGLGSPLPHLHRDWARPCHICTGIGPTPATSAWRLGSPLPHLHRDWAHRCPHLHRDSGFDRLRLEPSPAARSDCAGGAAWH